MGGIGKVAGNLSDSLTSAALNTFTVSTERRIPVLIATTVHNWTRAHHDWRFWIALILMLAAMGIYIISDNLAFLPR